MKPDILLTDALAPALRTLRNIAAAPRFTALLTFGLGYCLTIYLLLPHARRDPSSVFFKDTHGFEPRYSRVRAEQAMSYVNHTNQLGTPPGYATILGDYVTVGPSYGQTMRPDDHGPSLCLGVPTVARPGAQYIDATMGSLLEGLTPEERSSIFVVLLFAHTNPLDHPSYTERWSNVLPNIRLSYDDVNKTTRAQLHDWEIEGDYQSKALFDYEYLLDACATEAPQAPFVAIVEGDTLAARGWYKRAMAAAFAVESLDPASQHVNYDRLDLMAVAQPDADPQANWMYLRLFHTETYLGWNSEEWPLYLAISLALVAIVVICSLALRTYGPQRAARALTNRTISLLALALLPACILLYFALGRTTVHAPLPTTPSHTANRIASLSPFSLPVTNSASSSSHPSDADTVGKGIMTVPGASDLVFELPDYGCCAQGMLFPVRNLPFLRARLRERRVDYVDMLLEAAAGAWDLRRWAVRPSVLQHIGTRSSKGDAIADDRARRIWSFAFENFNPERGVE